MSDPNTHRARSPNRPKANSRLKLRVVRALTVLQHSSASVLGVFVVVHLAAPAAALVGGSSASNSVMLLGREYYQTALTEPLLLYTPLILHISSAFLKSALLGAPSKPSILGISGTLTALLLPLHVLTHRLSPSSSAAPVSALSPSMLDFEYVKVGLARWPVINWVLYGGLVISGLVHAVEGGALIVRIWGSRLKFPWTSRSIKSTPAEGGEEREAREGQRARRRRKEREALVKQIVVGGGVGVVLAGLGVIALEPLFGSRVMMARMESAWRMQRIFR